jgi:hypothetical protein
MSVTVLGQLGVLLLSEFKLSGKVDLTDAFVSSFIYLELKAKFKFCPSLMLNVIIPIT